MAMKWPARLAALGLVIASAVVGQAGGAQAQVPGPPSDNGIQPEFKSGNVDCAQLAPAGTEYFELKVEPVTSGSYNDGTLSVTIDVYDTAQGQAFDWTSNIGVDAVIVKGGPDTNVYTYDPPAESKGDGFLHAPVNPSNNLFFGLSHISFCYDIRASVDVDKTGDELSKVGDSVTYTFKITNDGDVAITRDDVSDSLLGALNTQASAAGCDSLAIGASCTFSVDRTVQAGDPDPLVNTVTVKYTGILPSGAADHVEASDEHSVNLFQPSVTLDKSGDALSKVGDEVTYTFDIENTSSTDTPNLLLDSLTDTVLGDLTTQATAANCGELASGDTCTVTVPYTVQVGDPDPLVNTATVHYHPDGFTNDISDFDSHELNLFQPAVSIDKTGDALSKVGDTVNYTITVKNESSTDTPDLTCRITDAFLGIDETVVLASGDQHGLTPSYTVKAGDPDPLVNTASVDCTIAGFTNTVSDSDSHSVELFQPAVTVDKTGPATASVGDTITYSFTITNTGSSDSPALELASVSDTVLGDLTAVAAANGCSTLAVTGSCTFTADHTIGAGDPNPLVNTVSVLYHPAGFPNDVTDDDDHSVEIVVRNEGCTPGFWKNHPGAWAATGYSPDQTLESVFDVPDSFNLDNKTLVQALSFTGGAGTQGAAQTLLRAGVAAVLNAAHPDVDYPRTTAEVIADVNAALASGDRATMLALAGELDADNNLGCDVT